MRILRIIARLNVGGPSIQAITLTNDLSSNGFKSVLVTGQVGSDEEDMEYLAREKGVNPIKVPELGREISIINDIKAFFAIRRIIRDFKPQIVHTHTAKAGTLGRIAAVSVNLTSVRSRIKIVHTFHGHVFHSYFKSYKTKIFMFIEKVLARFTHKIIVISNLQKIDICNRFKIANEKKVRVIPLGFDLTNFGKNRKTAKIIRSKYLGEISEKKYLVGIIGRLAPIKNHSLLIKAFKVLKDRKKDHLFQCIFVGDGELREKLMNEVLELNVNDLIVFAGWQKDVAAFYNAFDAVILTSKNEGTPVTLIEAMASGLPVAATDVGGVRDLLGSVENETDEGFTISQNGILIRPEDEEAVANALMFLLNEKEKSQRMASNAKGHVKKNYSFERLSNDIKLLYRELVPENNSELH
jgi:glycosyltransferase involved in cell wall biosynthesis